MVRKVLIKPCDGFAVATGHQAYISFEQVGFKSAFHFHSAVYAGADDNDRRFSCNQVFNIGPGQSMSAHPAPGIPNLSIRIDNQIRLVATSVNNYGAKFAAAYHFHPLRLVRLVYSTALITKSTWIQILNFIP